MRPEITTIIFSKNRACQLELLLRSMQQFQSNLSATVLYACDPDFKDGYDKLIGMYPFIEFIRETNFKNQLVEIICEGTQYISFFVDDDFMIGLFNEDCPEFREFKSNPDIICLNLRLASKYINDQVPVILKDNKCEWNLYRSRYNHFPTRDWGFPFAATSNILRRGDILPAISENELSTPNYLEKVINKTLPNRPLMLCFDEPKVMNNMANQVQTDFLFKNFGVSIKKLEEGFLKGERLSLEDMIYKASKAQYSRLITDYKWEKHEK